MVGRDALKIGLVGTRALEMQAWHSPGSSAVEEAYWEQPALEKTAPRKSRLRGFLDTMAAAILISSTPG